MAPDAPAVGKRIDMLRTAKYLQAGIKEVPTNSTIVRGKVVLVINSQIHLEFQVPAQVTENRRVFGRDISTGMKPLTQTID